MDEAERLARRLADQGAEVLVCPAIRRAPPSSWSEFDDALRLLAEGGYQGLLFTSPAGVRSFAERCEHLQLQVTPPPILGAVGRSTAAAMREVGLPEAIVPEREEGGWLAKALVAAHGDALAGKRFLQPRAQRGRRELAEGLRRHGATVDVVEAYRVEAMPPDTLQALREALESAILDAVLFASPSAVEAVRSAVPGGLGRAVAVAIGETTAGALRRWGVRSPAVATSANDEGLVAATLAALAPEAGGA